MGPDDNKMENFVMYPINPDGSFGEPVKWAGLKPITEWPESTVIGYDSIPLVASWTGEFNVKFRHHKISKKTFKKWLMANHIDRDLAERFCQIIGSFGGRISYKSIYAQSFLVPTPNTLLNSILNEGERTHV